MDGWNDGYERHERNGPTTMDTEPLNSDRYRENTYHVTFSTKPTTNL